MFFGCPPRRCFTNCTFPCTSPGTIGSHVPKLIFFSQISPYFKLVINHIDEFTKWHEICRCTSWVIVSDLFSIAPCPGHTSQAGLFDRLWLYKREAFTPGGRGLRFGLAWVIKIKSFLVNLFQCYSVFYMWWVDQLTRNMCWHLFSRFQRPTHNIRSERERGLFQRACRSGASFPCPISTVMVPMKEDPDSTTFELVQWPLLLPDQFATMMIQVTMCFSLVSPIHIFFSIAIIAWKLFGVLPI